MNGEDGSRDGDDAGSKHSSKHNIIALIGLVLVLVSLATAFVVANPTPLQYWVLRVTTALGVAAAFVVLPGKLLVKMPLLQNVVTAGGSAGIFALVYSVNPPPIATSATVVQAAYAETARTEAAELVDDIGTPIGGDSIVVNLGPAFFERIESETARSVASMARSLGTTTDSIEYRVPREPFERSIIATHSDRFAIQQATAQAVVDRVWNNQSVTRGVELLWIDDRPRGNARLVELFESMGIKVTSVTTDEEARTTLADSEYAVVVSDIARNGDEQAGLRFFDERKRVTPRGPPFVFYVGTIRKGSEPPAGSLGVTNQPDELVALVLGGLQSRSR